MVIPQCDKCGDVEFNIRQKEPPAPPKRQPASEYFSHDHYPVAIPDVLIVEAMVATCLGCGAQYEFSESGGL